MSKKKKLRRALKKVLREIEGCSGIRSLCGASSLVNGKRSHKRFLKLLNQFGDLGGFMFSNKEDRIVWLKLQIKATKKISKQYSDFFYEI